MLWRIRIYTYCCISSIYVFLTQRKITCWDLVRFCLLVIFRVFIYSDCLCRKFGVNGRRYLPPACVLLKLHTINKSRNPCCQCTITGIPISRPVAGVACGIVTSSDAQDPNKSDIEQYRLMTDILVRSVFSIHLSVHEITSFRNLQDLTQSLFLCYLMTCLKTGKSTDFLSQPRRREVLLVHGHAGGLWARDASEAETHFLFQS